jgi:hypothetical protein
MADPMEVFSGVTLRLTPRLNISPSMRLALLFMLLHIGAMVCIVLAAVPPVLQGGLLVMCVVSLLWCLLQHAWLKLPSAIVQLWVDENGAWHLQAKNGKVHSAHLQGDSIVTPQWLLLNFKQVRKSWGLSANRSIVLCLDSLDPVTFRRLRVYLNYFF